MFTTMSVQRLSAGTVYKILLVGLAASLVPLGVLFGLLALFGFDTVTWNGQPLHGWRGLLVGPLIGGLMAIMFTAIFGSAAVVGLWLYSKFRPMTLRAKGGV